MDEIGFDAHDRKVSENLARFPTCQICGQAIQQYKALRINGCWYCDDCVQDNTVYLIRDYE